MPDKVYCFTVHREDDYYDTVAVDSYGLFITAQISETPGKARDEIKDKFHKWFMDHRYPSGWEVYWQDRPHQDWDGRTCHSDKTVMPWHRDPENKPLKKAK